MCGVLFLQCMVYRFGRVYLFIDQTHLEKPVMFVILNVRYGVILRQGGLLNGKIIIRTNGVLFTTPTKRILYLQCCCQLSYLFKR